MQNENGVLAAQEDFGNALVDKYAPVWDKKYRSKGESIWVFQRRTLASACQVATTLHDMDFGKASTFLFHLVREAEECKPIIEAVSSQVELAMANSDKFIKGYHQFLQGLTKPIKKNKDYALYFKAIAYAQECVHLGLTIDGIVERNDSVLYAVIDMLMQGSEYLKPQEFDIVNNIVGISTENEPIIIRDPYPLADVPVYYSDALFNNRPYDKCDSQISEDRRLDMVFSYYKRYGYENVADFDSINNLAELALKSRDFNTFNVMQWFIAEQREEEVLFRGVLDQAKLAAFTGDSGQALFHLNAFMGKVAVRGSADTTPNTV